MPYIEDLATYKLLRIPPPDTSLWRYMDLHRFLSMLDEPAITFGRADLMEDKWEGAPSRRVRVMRLDGSVVTLTSEEAIDTRVRQLMTGATFMSCWHASEYESAAMWSIYQREGRGVAIRTTWRDLTECLRTNERVVGSKVRYVDYEKVVISYLNVYDPLLFKRRSFRHESEVRLLLKPAAVGPQPPVFKVPVDLGQLISALHTSPAAPAWQRDLIQRVVDRFGLAIKVQRSALDDPA